MKRRITMRAALADPRLLGNALSGDSWANWRVMLVAAMGERLRPEERRVFGRFTGRAQEPGARIEEALFLIGRRGGKDRSAAVLATYFAALIDWSPVLAKGERGLVLCIGADQRQAKITRDYIEGCFDASPMLSALVVNRTADSIELSNGIVIEVRAASFRRIRGLTCIAVIASETAFWLTDESSNPDTEILNAVRPSLATTGGPLVIITTPYARRGEVWNVYRRHFGPDGDPQILVAQGTSRDFNPTLSQKVIDRAMERDPAAAGAEYLAQFRSDIETFVSREAVEAAIIRGRHELPPMSGISYAAFVDPSGGASDSMTLAIAHRDRDRRVILDVVRERKPPFSPEAVVAEFAVLLKSYGVHKITGDRYGGEWPRERFQVHGIRYEVSEQPKSDIYRDLLPLLNSSRVELLDVPRLSAQLCGLERRTARSGKDSIDHAPGAHDDIANAVAGALLSALVAVPSMWAAEAFAPTTLPRKCGMLFAVLAPGKHGDAGVAYFAWERFGPLVIIDWEVKDLTPSVLTGIPARLTGLSDVVRTVAAQVYTTAALADELQRLGHPHGVEVADRIIAEDDGLLRLAAAKHINANRIRITKPDSYHLAGLLEAHDENPVKTALLVGIVLAFDEGRSLMARAA